MIEQNGNFLTFLGQKNHIVLATTNSEFHLYGLVMGAGTARQLREAVIRLTNIDPAAELLDVLLPSKPTNENKYRYGCCIIMKLEGWGYGAFQTKEEWRKPSSLDLISFSVTTLISKIHKLGNHITYHLPCPGCGLGGLDWSTQVKPLCQKLPDNVIIWNK